MNTFRIQAFLFSCVIVLGSNTASALPIVFSAVDNSAGSLVTAPNSVAMAALFDAAAGPLSVIDFESGLPAGITAGPGSITTFSGPVCGAVLCGYNTTTAGSFFYLAEGFTHTFTFSVPINAFGAYFTGWQFSMQTITYSDGGIQILEMPPGELGLGGTAFFGFIDSGASITSITYDALLDIVSVDDIRYGSVVPEPASAALLGLGLIALALDRR